jgi:serine protease Do
MFFNRYLIPICLIVMTLPSVPGRVDAAYEARAILAREVGAIAKKTVVRIESVEGGFGSGVIIGRVERGNKNIYTVLTAAHVVKSGGTRYKIITPIPLNNLSQKRRLTIDIDTTRNVKIIPNVDLAEISFESSYTFAIGTIGNSEYIDEGSPVYVAGFPRPGRAIKRIAMQFTGGMVSSRLDESDSPQGTLRDRNPQDQNNGYDLAYTNITRAGMSGGPVFDAAGRIVAIHGQGDRNNQASGESSDNGMENDEKTGFNLGIPIQILLKFQSQASNLVGARIDKSPVNYQLIDRSFTIGTTNKKFTRKFRNRSDSPPLFDATKVNEQTYD